LKKKTINPGGETYTADFVQEFKTEKEAESARKEDEQQEG
jgi:hypothetical protein